MNELDPDTRDNLLEIAEEITMADDVVRALLLMHHYGHQGYDLEDTVKAVMEAVG